MTSENYYNFATGFFKAFGNTREDLSEVSDDVLFNYFKEILGITDNYYNSGYAYGILYKEVKCKK